MRTGDIYITYTLFLTIIIISNIKEILLLHDHAMFHTEPGGKVGPSYYKYKSRSGRDQENKRSHPSTLETHRKKSKHWRSYQVTGFRHVVRGQGNVYFG